MKKRINKKGFTLMELLAAVAILGIIGTIGIVSVSKVIDSSHKKFDRTQYETFLQAAETYFSDNKSRLPLTPMEWKEITLQQLINYKYVEKLLDSNKNEFDYEKSKVRVTRLTSGKYKYEAVLYRKNGKTIGKISNKSVNQDSGIDLTLEKKDSYYHEDKTYYTNGYPVIDLNISDKDQLSGYQYIIYKDGKQFKKSENIEVTGGTNKKETVTLGQEFPFGRYSIKVVAYDKYGNKMANSTDKNNSGDSFEIYIDRIPPTCKIDIDGVVGDNGWYKERDISLTLVEEDKESGILKHDLQPNSKDYPNLNLERKIDKLVEKQSDTGNTTWSGIVVDKAGNKCETEVPVKVDTKKPKCEIVSNAANVDINDIKTKYPSCNANPSTFNDPINESDWYNKYNACKIDQLKLNNSDEGPSGVNRYILAMDVSNLPKTYKDYKDNNDTINTEESVNTMKKNETNEEIGHNYNGYVRDNAGNDVECKKFIKKDTIDSECPEEDNFYVEKKENNNEVGITFNWDKFSEDTILAIPYIAKVESSDNQNENWEPIEKGTNVFVDSAHYTYFPKPEENGSIASYKSKLVVYDRASNDNQQCVTAGTETIGAPPPEKIVCEYANGNYYDAESKIVSEEEYNKSCICGDDCGDGHGSCEISDGKYYGKDSEEITQEEYNKVCVDSEPEPNKPICVQVGNTYYDISGNIVSQEQYETSCGIYRELECPKITASTNKTSTWINVAEVKFTVNFAGTGAGSYEWQTYNSLSNEINKWKSFGGTQNVSEGTVVDNLTLKAEGRRRGKFIIHSRSNPSITKNCYTDAYWIDRTKPKCAEVYVTPKPKDGCHDYYPSDTDVTFHAECSDDISGCKKKSQKLKINTHHKGEHATVRRDLIIEDNAGNTNTCKNSIKVDGVAPKVEWYRAKAKSGAKCGGVTYAYVIYPNVIDAKSGYNSGVWKWKNDHKNEVNRNNNNSEVGHFECIGSSVKNSVQEISYEVKDCVGNVRTGHKKNFSSVPIW